MVGGSTIVVDLAGPTIQYVIYKPLDSATRLKETGTFLKQNASDPLRQLLLSPDRDNPFAALHAAANLGGF